MTNKAYLSSQQRIDTVVAEVTQVQGELAVTLSELQALVQDLKSIGGKV